MFRMLGLALAAGLFCAALLPAQASAKSLMTPAQLLTQLQKIALSDLQNADKIAQATGNTVAHTCWAALADLVQKTEAAQTDASGQPVKLPPVHIFTDAEKILDVADALQPTSVTMVACAPLLQQAQLTFMQLINGAAAGTLVNSMSAVLPAAAAVLP